ncbi:unnamed protein product [Moneuplotes crassus]|uniref:Helicase ATP-binding domain-containing protein n=1 Tax=Euplotes crassus TaxID=5936 RepID=A0AAD1XN47_EUPCR|nr:unnamed protein product [Moneuplotes crassus]
MEKEYHSIKVWNYEIKFPFERYDIQRDYMLRVIKACKKRENALLESPTGTGKTLCLLCASLAWLEEAKTERQDPSSFEKCLSRPKIIYCSRTHSQLAQVMDELKATPYRPRTALVASRDHMCIHNEISKASGMSLNIACNEAIRGGFNGIRCHYKEGIERQLKVEQFKDTWGIQDIEDLHEFGKAKNVCPYFLNKERAMKADLILMPYNYLIDEKIRENFDIDYKNAILIIDEAHNVGGVCEEVASLDISEIKLDSIIKEISSLKKAIQNKSEFGKTYMKDDQADITTTEAECIQLQGMVETMLKNIKQRKVSPTNWPTFQKRDGFLVSKFENIFKVLADISRDKSQTSLDSYKGQTRNIRAPVKTKVVPQYEEEDKNENTSPKRQLPSFLQSARSNKIKEESIADDLESYGRNSALNEVNSENITAWTNILRDAVKDLTKLIKKENNKVLHIEDLSQAFGNIRRINDKMNPEFTLQSQNDSQEEEKREEEPRFSRPTLGEIVNKIKPEKEDNESIKDDFYICITENRQKKMVSYNLGLWCFNPGFCFKQIKKLGVRSIILTSGTLSPMQSFAEELQTTFEIQLENSHVIQPSQVCMGVLPKGVEGNNFTFTYQTRNDDNMIDDLGHSICKVAEKSPDGMLIFFPSYFLMDKCYNNWDSSGILDKLEKYKSVYKEPKRSSQFKSVRRNFESDIDNGLGAVLFGVCRGKVSEGLDFSDKAARCVIIIGMPFAQFKDPKVVLKKEYLEHKYSQGKSHISGRDWYNQECSRAVNQAIGRVIRHINDYGLILLVDRRYGNYKAKQERSKWLRDRQVVFEDFEEAFQTIDSFFEKMGELKLPPKSIKKVKMFDSEEESKESSPMNRSVNSDEPPKHNFGGFKGFHTWKNQKDPKRHPNKQVTRAPAKATNRIAALINKSNAINQAKRESREQQEKENAQKQQNLSLEKLNMKNSTKVITPSPAQAPPSHKVKSNLASILKPVVKSMPPKAKPQSRYGLKSHFNRKKASNASENESGKKLLLRDMIHAHHKKEE